MGDPSDRFWPFEVKESSEKYQPAKRFDPPKPEQVRTIDEQLAEFEYAFRPIGNREPDLGS